MNVRRNIIVVSGLAALVAATYFGFGALSQSQTAIAKELRSIAHSRDLRTRAGLAASGGSANASPARSVAPMPPKIMMPADDQIGEKSVSMMKVETAHPPSSPAASATSPAAKPSKAERRAKLRRMVMRDAPRVFSTADS